MTGCQWEQYQELQRRLQPSAKMDRYAKENIKTRNLIVNLRPLNKEKD